MTTAAGTVECIYLNNISFWTNEFHLLLLQSSFPSCIPAFFCMNSVAQLQPTSMVPHVSKKALMKERNRNGPINNIYYLSGTSFSGTDDCCHGLCLPVSSGSLYSSSFHFKTTPKLHFYQEVMWASFIIAHLSFLGPNIREKPLANYCTFSWSSQHSEMSLWSLILSQKWNSVVT